MWEGNGLGMMVKYSILLAHSMFTKVRNVTYVYGFLLTEFLIAECSNNLKYYSNRGRKCRTSRVDVKESEKY